MALGWLRWCVWAAFGAVVASAICVAGVALGDIDRHFAWQAWHFVTWIVTLRGRRGTWRHRSSLCVAGVALGDINHHFAWQAWHFATWIVTLRGRRGACGTGWRAWAAFGLRGRRGTWRHRSSLCVAGVALRDMDRHFAWQAWHLLGLAPVAHLGRFWRRGHRRRAKVWHFAWQAWQRWAGTGGALGPRWTLWSPPRRLRGRRGTSRHRPSLCVAGIALCDIRFAWQAWHLWHWAGSDTIFDTPLCHTPSFTHHFVTLHFVTHHLGHTPSFTHHLSHNFVTHHL